MRDSKPSRAVGAQAFAEKEVHHEEHLLDSIPAVESGYSTAEEAAAKMADLGPPKRSPAGRWAFVHMAEAPHIGLAASPLQAEGPELPCLAEADQSDLTMGSQEFGRPRLGLAQLSIVAVAGETGRVLPDLHPSLLVSALKA